MQLEKNISISLLITKMNTFSCEKDSCDYYSFSQNGVDIHRSLMYKSIARSGSNLTGPPLRRPNRSVDCIKNEGEKRLKVDRLTTSICNHVLGKYYSELADYKNTGGDKSFSEET